MSRSKIVSRGPRIAFVALGLVAVTSLVSACTSGLDQSIDLPPQNRAEWTLPLDEFTYTSTPLRDYAEALLEKPCYAERGITWPVPWQPTDRNAGPSFSEGLQQLFNLDSARLYGYHKAPNVYDGVDEWKEFISATASIASSTPGFDDALAACRGASGDALPLPEEETLYYAISAARTINDEAESTPELEVKGLDWSACMEDRGYSGLAPSPNDAPDDSLAEKWQIGIPGTKASTEEIKMATADAECAESTGWVEAYYQAVWDLQVTFVSENSDRLTRVRTELQDDRDRLLRAVSENAPAKHSGQK